MQNYHPPCKLPLYKTAFNGKKAAQLHQNNCRKSFQALVKIATDTKDPT